MDFEKSFQQTKAPTLSSTERQKAAILIVDPQINLRQTMRQSLLGLGYGTISDAGDHAQALQKIEERHFTHLIFDARMSRISPHEFLRRAFELDHTMIAIASSYEPTIDDVFDLLIGGARGYIVKPFTTGSLDEALVTSTKGEPISHAVLNAKNRNEALASLILSSLDNLATILRQSQHFQTAKREIPQKSMNFRRAIDLGNTFSKGGPIMLQESLIQICLERGNGPASRLGRFRKRQEARKHRKDASPQDNETSISTLEEETVSLEPQQEEKTELEKLLEVSTKVAE